MMSNAVVRRVVILGALAIGGILFLQAYGFRKNWRMVEREMHQKVSIALLNVAKEMAAFNGSILPSTDLIRRIEPNYYVVNFNDIIDANVLEYYLLREFEAVQLNTDFEYAIYDCSSDEMVYGNYCNVDMRSNREKRSEQLPKYDAFIYYFGVMFPARTTFLLGDLGVYYIFAALTLLAVIFFIYSIFVILNQKRLSELQRDFINNMTHEFKTPISSIKISSDVFLHNPHIRNDARLSRYAEIISRQNERLNAHVEKVLSIARVDSGNLKLKKEEVDLHDLICKVAESKKPEVESRAGKMRFMLEARDPRILADQHHLSNVLYNLLDNAIKYSPDKPEITIETRSEGKHVRLAISDKGIGIPKVHQKHLFKKFFRVPTGNVHNVKGFGLGLHYVQKIVQKHHWQISVLSEEGKGSAFHIHIPVIA